MSSSCDNFFPERSRDRRCEGRARQWAKIREITESLRLAGFQSLDEQAEAIGLNRSTTWSILKGLHKNSGLSTTTIFRILSHKRLPAPVRKKLLEYVEEKARGLYGDSPIRSSSNSRRGGQDFHASQRQLSTGANRLQIFTSQKVTNAPAVRQHPAFARPGSVLARNDRERWA